MTESMNSMTLISSEYIKISTFYMKGIVNLIVVRC